MLAGLRDNPTDPNPVRIGNMRSIDDVLNHFNALQAYHLTTEYQKIIREVSEEAIRDQQEQDYLQVLSPDTFKTLMEQRIAIALEPFVDRAQLALKRVQQTGKAE